MTGSELTPAEHAQATAADATLVWREARTREQSLGTSSPSTASTATGKGFGSQVWIELLRNRSKRQPESHDEDGGGAIKRPRLSPSSDVGATKATTPCVLPPPPETELAPSASEPVGRSLEAVPFCTPRCILTLTDRAAPTDPSCPNSALHQLPSRYPFDLQSSIRSSINLPRYNHDEDTEHPPILWHNVSENAAYLHQYGATSVIFKVRVEPGGHVLVAKAARSWEAVEGLKNETMIYGGLRALQGDAIPVCAGLVDLRNDLPKPDSDIGWRFPAYLLLSWGGWPLLECGHVLDTEPQLERWKACVDAALRKVHDLDILHRDAELRNLVLQDQQDVTSGILLVDFERAVSKRRFMRRSIRARGQADVTPEEATLAFQQACDRERARCIQRLDAWARRMFSTR